MQSANIEYTKACIVDRQPLLAQDLKTFDQSPQGLRSVYVQNTACRLAAADLIAEYRVVHPKVGDDFNAYLLYWHEGQLRAQAGDYAAALPLLERARMTPDVPADARVTWNLYVDATVAFMMRDRAALTSAQMNLQSIPVEYRRGKNRPPNLDVVDALVRCFNRSYSEAYGTCKTAAIKGSQ